MINARGLEGLQTARNEMVARYRVEVLVVAADLSTVSGQGTLLEAMAALGISCW